MALCKPAATELKSKNAHGVSLFSDPFFDIVFDLYFDFTLILIVP